MLEIRDRRPVRGTRSEATFGIWDWVGQRDVGPIGMQIKVNKCVSGSYEVPSGLLISISYGILPYRHERSRGFRARRLRRI